MTDDNGRQNGLAWFASIVEMVDALREDRRIEGQEAREVVAQSVLSVEVRSGWYDPTAHVSRRDNQRNEQPPAEFKILLSTGGPALRLIGELNEHGEPETARLEHQDWGTPWTSMGAHTLAELTWPDEYFPEHGDRRLAALDKARDYLLDFARCFYFGEV